MLFEFSLLVNMVVKNISEKRVNVKHDETGEHTDSDHSEASIDKNGAENINGTEKINEEVSDRLQNVIQDGEECSDEELSEAVDLTR